MTKVQCTRCFGRGYQPEARKPSKRNPRGIGFYARTCPGCQGAGEREPKTPLTKLLQRESAVLARERQAAR